METKLEQRLAEFVKNPARVHEFKDSLEKIEFLALLNPSVYAASYPKEFLARVEGRPFPFPFLDPDFHLECVRETVEKQTRAGGRLHPVLAYAALFEFREQFGQAKRPAPAKPASAAKGGRTAVKSAPSSAREALRKRRYLAVQKVMAALDVPSEVKRAKSPSEVKDAALRVLGAAQEEHAKLRERMHALESELEVFKNPEYAHTSIKSSLQQMQAQNSDLAMKLIKEQNRADLLESEIQRLTDHILAHPAEGELDSAKREYNLISQKYDALVTRNIELSNRIKELGRPKRLEEILDQIRDKINHAIRSGLHEKPDAMLRTITEEISQLQRARLYLGRALYDIGILYHRKGDTNRAKEELRAARELGVRDSDVENILKS